METEQEAEGYKERLAEIKQQTKEITEQFQEPKFPTDQERQDIDLRSVYVGNVDYGSTPLQVQQHFSSAGVVNRVTILKDKFTGQPRGFAYVEFEDPAAVDQAVAMLDGSTFNDRELKVSAKRTNIPGVTTTSRGGRGRGRGRGAFRGRGRGRGGFRGGFRGRGGYAPY